MTKELTNNWRNRKGHVNFRAASTWFVGVSRSISRRNHQETSQMMLLSCQLPKNYQFSADWKGLFVCKMRLFGKSWNKIEHSVLYLSHYDVIEFKSVATSIYGGPFNEEKSITLRQLRVQQVMCEVSHWHKSVDSEFLNFIQYWLFC